MTSFVGSVYVFPFLSDIKLICTVLFFFWQVYYSFNPIFMLAEPLMLVSAFFFFFVACVAYLHVDLSISKMQ